MPEPMLELDGIRARRGKIEVLWDVSLMVKESEIVALVGGNGAGKTSTLDTVSGLVRPFAGEVRFRGRRIDALAPHLIVKLGISYVPEGGKPFPDMTVRENLELGAFLFGNWKTRKKSMERVFDLFPRLGHRSSQLANTLSGGERQMLAVGRCLMARPKLCLIDEPSYGLAPIVVKELLRLIESLRDEGITILLVEQNVNHALDIADRAYVLENGRVVMEGDSSALRTNDHIRKAYMGL